MLRLSLLLIAANLFAQQPVDESYTKKIREFTTDPMFLTELVDHLPASSMVPTPEKVLGYIAGAADKLTYAKDVYRYMREVEKTSPRVKVLSIGQTEEGREMIVVLVSEEANLAKLDRYKEITAKLADPRGLKDDDARVLIKEGLPFYWATGAIHAPETGSPEMLMELVYRLAVEETPFIQTIRKNTIVMVTPVIEVDGRERQVDLYRYRKANPDKPAPSLLYWGKYVAHDNNRDGIGLSLAFSRNITRTFLQYHPQVLHDLHESVPFLYTSTGMGPYNAWLDPIVINEWQKLAWHEVEEMTKRGVPGVWTWGFYDGWGANYLMQVAHGHNSIGRFYETFGNGGADTRDRTIPASESSRAWYRPNPPLSRVKWSHRNNVNLQESALLLAMNFTAENRETFLSNFWLKSKRAVAKAATEGPAAYIIDHTVRPSEASALSDLLKLHGIEVHRLSQETEIAGTKHASGSYVVRMDQPFSRMADMYLDRQFYSATDTTPYDDTGWTLTALRNLKSTRITDAAILKAPMVRVGDSTAPEGRVVGNGQNYLVQHNADRILATFRFSLKDVRMQSAEEPFEAAGQKFGAGAFVITADRNHSDLKNWIQAAAADCGVTVYAVKDLPKVKLHSLGAPRIALVHNWQNTQNEGWFRLGLESTRVPYTYISDQKLGLIDDLRAHFDVILLGPSSVDSRRVVHGLPMRGAPIPWKQSELTPNFGSSPDQTDDIRGGMGLQGLMKIQKFVEDGGLFITIAGNASMPVDFGLIDGISITPPRDLKVRGSVLDSVVADAKSPIAYGYAERLPVYFNSAPILQVANPGGSSSGSSDGAPVRASGRGTTADGDIVQGRPPMASEGPEPDTSQTDSMRSLLSAPAERPRTILRFADEKDLLISGMLAGGKELAGKPAVVDVPRGKGHFLLFAINPMWRQETQGSFMLLLNAAMNFESLGVGR